MGARNPWIETPEQRNVIEAETLKPWRNLVWSTQGVVGLRERWEGSRSVTCSPQRKPAARPARHRIAGDKYLGLVRRRRRRVVGGGD